MSEIPCQALVLIPVSVLFLSTKRADRGSENVISCEREQENTSSKGEKIKVRV